MSKKTKRFIKKKIRKAFKNSDVIAIGSKKIAYFNWGAGPSQTSLGKTEDLVVGPT